MVFMFIFHLRSTPAIVQISDSVEDRQQELLRQRKEERRRQLETDPSGAEVSLIEQPKELQDTSNFVSIGKIIFLGMTLFSEKDFAETISSTKGDCVYLSRVNNIIQVVTNSYVKKGLSHHAPCYSNRTNLMEFWRLRFLKGMWKIFKVKTNGSVIVN